MSRLPSLSSRQIIAVLRRAGFGEAPDRGKGSHRALYRADASGRVRLVIVPQRKDVPRGTLLAILDQAGLSRDEFLRYL
ncbi:MAG: type II toxin-antitoxin system HicA family toxin [Planctomycetes bacterium]|nr:type II toxin-antitoxin system HicA family toxin [Planctomycetota bacterium]